MARRACVAAMTRAMGRPPLARELLKIEERIGAQMRILATTLDKQGNSIAAGMSPRQRLDTAASLAMRQLMAEAAKERQRVALTIIAKQRLDDYTARHPVDELEAMNELAAFKADAKGRVTSLEVRSRSAAADANRQLLALWEAGGEKYLGLMQDREGVERLIREILREPTGDPVAKDAAAVWAKVTDDMNTAWNDAGGDTPKRGDWGYPHHHDATLVGKAGGSDTLPDVNRDAWVEFALPMVDRKRYRRLDGAPMSDGDLRTWLGEAWITIATGGALEGDPGLFRGDGKRASRHSEARQIHFKDADSWIKYQNRFGGQELFQTLSGHIHNLARDTALIEVLGPSADHNFETSLEAAYQAVVARNPLSKPDALKRMRKIQILYDEVAGKTEPPVSQSVARWASDLRSLLVGSRLGSALITSFGDEGTMAVTAHVNKMSYLQVWRTQLDALDITNDVELARARRQGMALDTMIGTLVRFGNENLTTPLSRIASAAMRASFLPAATEARQRSWGTVMMDGLGQLTRTHSFAQLESGDYAILQAKGVSEAEWLIWREAQLEDWGNGNKGVLTPDAVNRVDDATIDRILTQSGPALTTYGAAEIRRARRDAVLKLLGVVREEIDMAVITPGIRDRANTTLGTQRGTKRGELVRSIFLFKSFPMAMISRHYKRATSGQVSRAQYAAALIATTTIAGAAATQLNEIISGRDPRAMLDWRFALSAMLKGGSLGIYGDFLFSQSSQHGSSAVASLLGPAVGLAEEFSNLSQGNFIQLMQGEDTRAGAEAVKFIKGITPFSSTWYLKAAFDHLIFQNMMEYLSPGYVRRIESRAKDQFGQQYWWRPGQNVPGRAPDLGRALTTPDDGR